MKKGVNPLPHQEHQKTKSEKFILADILFQSKQQSVYPSIDPHQKSIKQTRYQF